ncbi:MAG: OmpA family protein [Saprospiraceae bacterium]
MNRTLFWILVIFLALWLLLGSWFIKCQLCGIPAAAAVAVAPAESTRLLIQDGAAFKSTATGHFDFNESNNTYLTPLTTDVNNSINQTAAYLKANPNRSITITGLYAEEEANNSVFPSLGLARANEVKKAMVASGVSAKQLLTADQLLASSNAIKEGVLMDGVNFSFTATTEDLEERLAAIKSRLDANPVTIYFPTGEQIVTLNQSQRQDFADLVFYLDNVAGSSLEVGGHTDNVGDLALNTRLSRKRAEFVRDYLTANGLQASSLTAQGYGPNAPIAPNTTKEGKAKNRRVEVRLK